MNDPPIEDKDILGICKEGIVTELIHRYVSSHLGFQTFYDQADELLKDVSIDTLRKMVGTVIRGFGYGRKPTTILWEIERYRKQENDKLPFIHPHDIVYWGYDKALEIAYERENLSSITTVKENGIMTKYECGHESEMLALDGSPTMLSAYLRWSEGVETYGDKSMCFKCWYDSSISTKIKEGDI